MEIPERVWNRVDTAGPDDCWLWTGPLRHGAQFQVDGERYILHRVVWENANGRPLDDEREVVRTSCEDRRCHNPAHLIVMDRSEMRAGWAKDHAEATHCPQGHAYDEANTHIDPRGRRRCRQCNTDRLRERRRKQRAEENR